VEGMEGGGGTGGKKEPPPEKQGEEAHKQAQSRCGQLEQELAGLRQSREQLNTQFSKEQQATAESGKRVKELEAHLGQRAGELERAKAELEKQGQERARVESELRRQLETATSAAKQGEEARSEERRVGKGGGDAGGGAR